MRSTRIGIPMLPAVAALAALMGCRPSSHPPQAEPEAGAAIAENPDASPEKPDASAEPPALPEYDLDADLRTRVDTAKRLWGPSVRIEIVADTFVFVAADRGVPLEKAVSLAKNALDALFHDRFRAHPDRAVTVTLWSTAAGFEAYCKTQVGPGCGDDLGEYIVRTSEILVNTTLGLTTLTHEIVHPIVQHDFPFAPKWLNEGIASLYETPAFPSPGEIHGLPNWRMPPLAMALQRSDERSRPHLDALFGMNDATFFNRDRLLHYAMARAVCEWLDERNALWPFYQAWRDGGNAEADGSLAFESAVHEMPAQANREWTRWVLERSRGYRR